MSAARLLSILTCLLAAATARAWTPETLLTSEFSSALARPGVAVTPDGRVHVVFAAQTSGNQLNFRHKFLTGTNWSAAIDLPGPNCKEPDLALTSTADGHLHVVGIYRWNSCGDAYSVYYWEYNGTSWAGPTLVSSGSGDDGKNCTAESIAADRNGDIHVVWQQGGQVGGGADIMYRKRQAGAWQAIRNVTSNGPGTSYGSNDPFVACDHTGANVHVVWHDDFLDNGFQVYYTKNTNLGDPSAWLPANQWTLLSSCSYGKSPRVVIDRNDYPNVFFIDRLCGSTNYTVYRRWNGTSWTAPIVFKSVLDAVFDAGNLMHFVFSATAPDSGKIELFYNQWNFSTYGPDEYISTGGSTSKVDFGALTLSSTGVPLAAWEERKLPNGTSGIYYAARSTYSGPVGTVAGTVKSDTNVGVVGATVAAETGDATLTGAGGAFSLPLPPGVHTLTAFRASYTSQTVSNVSVVQNQTTTVNFTITGVAPESVTNTYVTPGNTSSQLHWRHSTSASSTGTMIRFGTTGYPAGPTDGTLLVDQLGAGDATTTHSGLVNGTIYYYSLFAHDGSAHYAPGVPLTATPALRADRDRDGDVDQADFGEFQACLTGFTVQIIDADCQWADMNNDIYNAADSTDLGIMLSCLSGPEQYANPACGP